MKYIDLPFTHPAENLAWDEALLDAAEDGSVQEDILLFWESNRYFVVVGYANSVATEVNVAACEADNVPIYRRSSGGGTVLQGHGCLNYSLVMKIEEPVRTISATNRYIMEKQRAALEQVLRQPVQIRGHTDLTLNNLKFSGNAQRRKREHLIFHGSFLAGFDLAKIEKYLRMPSQEPDYRKNRSHTTFLTNLNVPTADIKEALKQIWQANGPAEYLPLAKMDELVQKYSSDEWNRKF